MCMFMRKIEPSQFVLLSMLVSETACTYFKDRNPTCLWINISFYMPDGCVCLSDKDE